MGRTVPVISTAKPSLPDMLDSLLAFHDQIADKLPPVAYKERSIEWILKLDAYGTEYSFVETSDRVSVPDRDRTSGNSRPRLLDTAEWALGVPEKGKESRAADRHSNYLDLVDRAATEIDHGAVAGYNRFLRSIGVTVLPEEIKESLIVDVGGEARAISANMLPEGCKPGDRIIVCVDNSGKERAEKLPADMDRSDRMVVTVEGEAIHELPEVKRWWAEFIDEVKSKKITEHGPCAMCGEERPIARLHESIRRFDEALSSYNEDAFESYGKTQSYNAWMCQQCARRVSRTLSWLYDSDDHSYYFNNTSWVHWTETVRSSFSLNPIRVGDPNKVRRLLSSYYDGTLIKDQTPLWILSIEKNQGRLIVRHLERSTVGRIQARMAKYFDAMEVRGRFFGATALLMSLIQTASRNKTPGDIPAWMEAGLMRTALTGQALPYPFLLTALNRNQALGSVSGPRAALLKLYLTTNRHDMPSALDPEYDSTAYQLGRLFAVLENVQYQALDGPNTTIADSFFKSASTTPQSVFGTLLSKSQAHLSKLRKNSQSAFTGSQRKISEIMNRIHPDRLPKRLSPEEQATFSLGYYHQRQQIFDDIEAAKVKAGEG